MIFVFLFVAIVWYFIRSNKDGFGTAVFTILLMVPLGFAIQIGTLVWGWEDSLPVWFYLFTVALVMCVNGLFFGEIAEEKGKPRSVKNMFGLL